MWLGDGWNLAEIVEAFETDNTSPNRNSQACIRRNSTYIQHAVSIKGKLHLVGVLLVHLSVWARMIQR